MDISLVVQLTCHAAESVLRFRAMSFTGRPMIDLQHFRDTIAKQIKDMALQSNNPAVVPLGQVANYASLSAASAAIEWNRINLPENLVSMEWFRTCVLDLVGGVVTDIATHAFAERGVNASKYLNPNIYDPFSSFSSVPVPTQEQLQYMPPRPNFNEGAVNADTERGEIMDPSSSTSPAAELDELTISGTHRPGDDARKRRATSPATSGPLSASPYTMNRPANQPEATSGSASLDTLSNPAAKRTRLPDSAPVRTRLPDSAPARTRLPDSAPARPSGSRSSAGSNASASRGYASPNMSIPRSMRWTENEVRIMREAREAGENWTTIQRMVPRHSKEACQSKYQVIIGNRGRSDLAARNARGGAEKYGRAHGKSFGSREFEEDVEPDEGDE